MNIPFESTNDTYRRSGFFNFRVGTCEGLWRVSDTHYEILAVINRKRGNGHFKKALWWFEQSCRRDGKKLMLREVWNPFLYFKSVQKFNFTRVKGTWFTLEKSFT